MTTSTVTLLVITGCALVLTARIAEAEGPSTNQPRLTRPQRWESLLTDSQYQQFMDLVATDLKGRRFTPTLQDDAVTVKEIPGVVLGLDNLVRKCVEAKDQTKWRTVIAEHFTNAIRSFEQDAANKKRMENFTEMRPLLLVRIYPEGWAEAAAVEKTVHRVDLEGTVTTLVVRFGEVLKAVRKDEAAPWGKTDDELFAIALTNVSAAKPKEVEKDIGGAKMVVLLGEEMYSSSHCLLLKEHPSAVGKFGAFVAVPSRQVVMAVPVNDSGALTGIKTMMRLAHDWYASDPGPVTENLYWFDGGKFTQIAYERKGDDLFVKPTKEVYEKIEKLPKREE